MLITTEQAIESLRKIVADKGEDYIYTGACAYDAIGDETGRIVPRCVVGHVLYDTGVRDQMIDQLGMSSTLEDLIGGKFAGSFKEFDIYHRRVGQSITDALLEGIQNGVTVVTLSSRYDSTDFDVQFEALAVAALEVAQEIQDGSRPWGEALAAAERVIEDVSA